MKKQFTILFVCVSVSVSASAQFKNSLERDVYGLKKTVAISTDLVYDPNNPVDTAYCRVAYSDHTWKVLVDNEPGKFTFSNVIPNIKKYNHYPIL